ncbi:MAG: cation diffusion facilitator family transporter [Myxococcota bacterium]
MSERSPCGLDTSSCMVQGIHAHCAKEAGTTRLAIILALTLCYMLVEVVGGWVSGSLSLLADASHMLSDSLVLILSLVASCITRRTPNLRYSFGYHRCEVLAAFVSGLLLLSLAGSIFMHALQRFSAAALPETNIMLSVASGGLLVNSIGLILLHSGRTKNLNLRAAWLHLLGDMLGSVMVLLSGVVVSITHWHWVDPLASILLSLLVAFYSILLVRDALNVLMESAPRGMNVQALHQQLLGLPGTAAIHQLHVWSISRGIVAASAHVVAQPSCDRQSLLRQIHQLLKERFDICHATVQLEVEQEPLVNS